MINKLICWLKGHKRGRHIKNEDGMRIFACPRCKRETKYKEATKAA